MHGVKKTKQNKKNNNQTYLSSMQSKGFQVCTIMPLLKIPASLFFFFKYSMKKQNHLIIEVIYGAADTPSVKVH